MGSGPTATGGTRRPGRSLEPGCGHRAGVTLGDLTDSSDHPDRVSTCGEEHAAWGGFAAGPPGHPAAVFFFFSNRLGCLGSLAVSALLTVLLLLLFDVI